MSSILDIEGTIEAGNQYMMENWYWDTFLPLIDQLNISTDYHYIYRDFDIRDAISKGLQLIESEEVTIQWLCDNGKAHVACVSYVMNDRYDKYYKLEDAPICIIPDREMLLTFADEFYWDMQKVTLGRKFAYIRYACNVDWPINYMG